MCVGGGSLMMAGRGGGGAKAGTEPQTCDSPHTSDPSLAKGSSQAQNSVRFKKCTGSMKVGGCPQGVVSTTSR